ncbi:lysozyme inhibitor LprI family protein [Methylocaldum szegediense]|jgi:uncharacterized protein YecT (DUF1311 family)|uniref:Lysozyme inhibitor LprI-like N-terminal domain-containing protein n=1 Tax=Methylocaldum szegediense TaxID=73780 RepID=A0ABN8WYW6_9GAMM|nr:lysozyme inhibitor LprI family protein [Methylocaldum szegediense]CAI8767921.1 conserved protein of unknown function [Methylocaldum szegediense]
MTLKVVFITLLLAPVITYSEDLPKCNRDGTQLEINACAADEFDKAERKLNEVYRALLKKEEKNVIFIQKLRAAQRAWLAFRDAELEAMYACEEGSTCWGTILPLCYADYKTKLTRERTQRLQQFLDKGHPADNCYSERDR